ncbi:hypothetical protein ACFDTO_21260 [Microbacteriaceae bacterium 4G12]
MSNPKTTNTNYNMVQESLPLDIQEETVVPKKKNERPTFIPYNNQQSICLLDLQELIPANHVSRVVDEMMERIEDDLFFQHYKGGGRRSYHPKMMVKIIL